MKKIRAIIVDDEPDARESLLKEMEKSCQKVEVIALAGSAEQAMEEIEKHHPDMIFLDVEMPGKSGLELARDLKDKKIKTSLVFVTAYDQYAIEAIRYAAFDYLLKPVVPEELRKVIDRYIDQAGNTNMEQKISRLDTWLSSDRLRFEIENGYILARPDDIMFCQSDGKTTVIALNNGRKEQVLGKLKKIHSLLPSGHFVLINSTVCINLNYLVKVDRKTRMVFLENMLVEYQFKASPWKMRHLK